MDRASAEDALADASVIVDSYLGDLDAALDDRVGEAWLRRGELLELLDRPDEAAIAFASLAENAYRSRESSLWRARALIASAKLLGASGSHVAEVGVYEDVDAMFDDERSPRARGWIARASYYRSAVMLEAGLSSPEQVITVTRAELDRFADGPECAWARARLLLLQGVALKRIGKADEAIAVCSRVRDEYVDAADPAVRSMSLQAVINICITLGERGQRAMAIAEAQTTLDRHRGAVEPAAIALWVALSANLANILRQDDRLDGAVAVLDTALDMHASSQDARVRENCCWAMRMRAKLLRDRGDVLDALDAYTRLIDEYGVDLEPETRHWVGVALVDRIAIEDEPTRQLQNSQDALDLMAGWSTFASARFVAAAMWGLARSQYGVGATLTAIETLDALTGRFATDSGMTSLLVPSS